MTDTAFIQPKLPLTPADQCLVAAKSYATIYLNSKSPKLFSWSHRSLTKSLLAKGSLGPVDVGRASSVCFPQHLKVTGLRLSRPLFTQSNQSRTENALCGAGGAGGGRLAKFMGSHFVALAESATVCWNKSGAKIWFVYFDLCTFSEYKRVLIGNLGKRRKCLLILLKAQNVHSVKGAICSL